MCTVLNLIANAQNKLLYYIGGWKALLVTAWIGTPIHEFSHIIAALISGHKIVDFKLFQPDERTGTLGYVSHSYNPNNFYQSVIGNTLIPIAPFFGSALAIYLLTYFLLPGFSLYANDVPRVHYITSKNAFIWQSYVMFGKSVLVFFKFLVLKVQQAGLFSKWHFYVSLFMLFGIANHLSPSWADFQNFWHPLFAIIIFTILLNLIILPFTRDSLSIIHVASKYIMLATPILLLALFISLTGFIIIYAISLILAIFRG